MPENLVNPFKNFVVNAILFSIVWNEEIETCLEFPPWLTDLVSYVNRAEGIEVKPKKKAKKMKNQEG